MRPLMPVVLCALFLLSDASEEQAIKELFSWVHNLGGVSNAEVKENAEGIRGLFATRDLQPEEDIMAIPASAIINVGGLEHFEIPALTLLKELHTPCTRFKPYIGVFPGPDEVVNGCNIPAAYLPLFYSEYWAKKVQSWQETLRRVHTGQTVAYADLILPEVVGDANVTLEELKYVCALTATRYISGDPRKRLIMVPIFDMANHVRDCPHYVQAFDDNEPVFRLVAGAAIKAGEEVCYDYGDLRDDYAVVHYGFLPARQDPPLLATVDHHNFTGDPNDQLDPGPFSGSRHEVLEEGLRLQKVLEGVLALEAATPLPPVKEGTEYVYQLLLDLHSRRKSALRAEILRLLGQKRDDQEL